MKEEDQKYIQQIGSIKDLNILMTGITLGTIISESISPINMFPNNIKIFLVILTIVSLSVSIWLYIEYHKKLKQLIW